MPYPEVIVKPRNYLPRIEHLWAFVSSDKNGEGLIATNEISPGTLMPLIAADEKRLDQLIPIAQRIAARTEEPIKLVKFTVREEIRIITP